MSRGGRKSFNRPITALSPSCPCDLVLLKDGNVFRMEVTTGHNSSSGRLIWTKKDPQLHDILAVVTPDSIIYFTEHADLKAALIPSTRDSEKADGVNDQPENLENGNSESRTKNEIVAPRANMEGGSLRQDEESPFWRP